MDMEGAVIRPLLSCYQESNNNYYGISRAIPNWNSKISIKSLSALINFRFNIIQKKSINLPAVHPASVMCRIKNKIKVNITEKGSTKQMETYFVKKEKWPKTLRNGMKNRSFKLAVVDNYFYYFQMYHFLLSALYWSLSQKRWFYSKSDILNQV